MIGITPAAGYSTRMYGLPKFLLPIGDSYLLTEMQLRMRRAGAGQIYTGIHPRHYNLSAVWPDRTNTYWIETDTMNETILAAKAIGNFGADRVLFGMPDTYWTDAKVYERLIEVSDALVTVALWQTPEQYRHKRGMCEIDATTARIYSVIDKPEISMSNIWGWGAMIWWGAFWDYILPEDAHVGFALQRAIDDGQKVQGVVMDGQFWDCGTPDEYFDCIWSIEQHRHETASVKV